MSLINLLIILVVIGVILWLIYAVPPKLDNNLRWKNLKLI